MEGWVVFGVGIILLLMGQPLYTIAWYIVALDGGIPTGDQSVIFGALVFVFAAFVSRLLSQRGK